MSENISETGTRGTRGTGGTASIGLTRDACEGMPQGFGEDLWGLGYDDDLRYIADEDTMNEGSEPKVPLPTFCQKPDVWPRMIQNIVDKGATPAQRDIMLLGTMTILGATIGKKARVMYDGKYYSPNMQLFVVAPPASGKGKLSLLRHIAQPFHDELREDWLSKMKDYKSKKLKWDYMGKERQNMPENEMPVMPVRKYFIIPGNNSGTGMQANIIDSDGRGLIFEVEADTMTTSLNADYGHFDDALRKFFDHEGVSYYRRTDNESKEVERTYVSVLLSGTPGQVPRLLKSSENGLFSRFMFYYMPSAHKWMSQFGEKTNLDEWFMGIGKEWKQQLEAYNDISNFTLELTETQTELFDLVMSGIYTRAEKTMGDEAISVVLRIAHHILRIMEVTSLVRAFENPEAAFRPAPDIPADNVKDGIVSRYVYGIAFEDFSLCVSMAQVLFRHSLHILSMLPAVETSNRGSSDKDTLFSFMGEKFTRKAYLDKAGEMGIIENTALQWLKRGLKRGQILKVGKGEYEFVPKNG